MHKSWIIEDGGQRTEDREQKTEGGGRCGLGFDRSIGVTRWILEPVFLLDHIAARPAMASGTDQDNLWFGLFRSNILSL